MPATGSSAITPIGPTPSLRLKEERPCVSTIWRAFRPTSCNSARSRYSSNHELPFFNIESPEGRGVLVGLGWTGNWLAQFTGAGTQLEAQAGMPLTSFRLHPGEKVRGPRVLLVFWNGQRLHGNNMLRRVLYEHYLPRLPGGKPHEPLVSVNTCFTYHGGGGYLEAVTEKSLLGAGSAVHRIGGRGLRDRRRILQLQELAGHLQHERLLLLQGTIPARLSPDFRAAGQGGRGLRLVVHAGGLREHGRSASQGKVPGGG